MAREGYLRGRKVQMYEGPKVRLRKFIAMGGKLQEFGKKVVNKALHPMRRHRKALMEKESYYRSQEERVRRGEISSIREK